ncbi:LAFE_0H09428g1_1 [Lachancea fermentati]|uniref:Glutamate pyruvate transaminase n=1 Tax=Lachancea fermentati TaxID=4955 RepID=A0A1G4MK45_LACFM|nr:LAFE_0H09428g1_1 [Lachancea fermentati]
MLRVSSGRILSQVRVAMPHSTYVLRQLSTTGVCQTFEPSDKLGLQDVNENVLKAKYAVRGRIPQRAEELKRQLADKPSSLPFSKIINANIGNPQQLDQKPLTFYRQVLSLLQNPDMVSQVPREKLTQIYAPDAVDRAKRMLDDIGGSVGAYSHSQGVQGFRETVAEFISKRDGVPASANDIFLTAGASAAVANILSILCRGKETGVLIPIPQYPLYTATLALNDSHALAYYLDEESNWSTDPEQIEHVVKDAQAKGITPTCLVVINPGNPTGAILSVEAIEKIFSVAAKHGIVVIADEVYQENVFHGAKFHSMKQVLRNLQKRYPGKYDNVQLASLHSTSKGVSGECGQRGGYMELVGFSDEIKQVFLKLASISLCPVVTGQALVDLMVCPPQKGEDSYEQDQNERTSIHDALDQRSSLLYETFQRLEGISCQKPQGAMYLFPRLELPQKAIQKAHELNIEPDEFYCQELLEETGICTVPGSGFGQVPGTYHLRTTFLAPGTEWIKAWEEFHKKFYHKYHD